MASGISCSHAQARPDEQNSSPANPPPYPSYAVLAAGYVAASHSAFVCLLVATDERRPPSHSSSRHPCLFLFLSLYLISIWTLALELIKFIKKRKVCPLAPMKKKHTNIMVSHERTRKKKLHKKKRCLPEASLSFLSCLIVDAMHTAH